MKKFYITLLVFLLITNIASAAERFWVGPISGRWTVAANWASTLGGVGGAGVPRVTDNVIFFKTSVVEMDNSVSINSLVCMENHGRVTLFAKKYTTITIVKKLAIGCGGYLKDSTSENVLFDVNFRARSSSLIEGDWIFVGRVPVTATTGASFTATGETVVTVNTKKDSTIGGRIISMRNSRDITSTNQTLKFNYNTYYVSENVLNTAIPFASWAKDSIRQIDSYGGTLVARASTILLSGYTETITHLGGVPYYGRMVVDLSNITKDISLDLVDGSKIRGNLEIKNTNNHNLTLCSAVSPTNNTVVEIGTLEAGYLFGGYVMVSDSSRVTVATSTAAAPGAHYTLLVDKSFHQSGGNFSLQDYDLATGSSTLDIRNDLIQTGGTFITNSKTSSTKAKFTVFMNDPIYHAGPSGSFHSDRVINMSSGSIDNGSKMVTLRIDHKIYNIPGYGSYENGVILKSPLQVGKLELIRSPLTTTATNVLTVLNPSQGAILISNEKTYVNGPLRRATNAAEPYSFPIGKGNCTSTGYMIDSCIVVPVSTAASMYQAEYFRPVPSVASTASPLQGIANNKYWNITRISGANARVTLVLKEAVTGSSYFRGIVVANYVSPSWEKVNGNLLTPGTETTGSVTSKNMSSFGMFTFGYGVPTALIQIIRAPNLGTSTLESNSVASQKIPREHMAAPTVFPNPFADNFTMEFNNAGETVTNTSLRIFDLKGSLVYTRQLTDLVAGRNLVKINLADKNLPAGTFIGQLNVNGVVISTIKLVKVK